MRPGLRSAKRQRLEVVRLRSALQHRRVLSAKRQRLLLPPLLPRRRLLRRLVSLLLQINRLDLVPPRRLPAEAVLARWRVKVVVEVVLAVITLEAEMQVVLEEQAVEEVEQVLTKWLANKT